MRSLLAVAAVVAPLAAAHSWSPCGANASQAEHGTVVQIINPGGNLVKVGVCSSADNATCSLPGEAAPCTMEPIAANTSIYVNVTANASNLVFWYHTPWVFDWHQIVSAKPAVAAFPQKAFLVPYPATPHDGEATLCDSDGDCRPGQSCATVSKQRQCMGPFPSPQPMPTAPPVPSPSPRPPASSCNLTGAYINPYIKADGLGHGASADVNITMTSARDLTWSCVSKTHHCPGGVDASNGTGTLSPSGDALVLRLSNGSVVPAVVNNTLSCSPIVLSDPAQPGVPLQWDLHSGVGALLNLDVSMASFLGGPGRGGDAGQPFSGAGVAVLATSSDGSSATVAVAGNGPGSFGAHPELLFGASASSNATVVIFEVDLSIPRRSSAAGPAAAALGSGGAKVRGVAKLGGRVDHLRTDGKGRIAVAGSFGVASMDTSASVWGGEGVGGPVFSLSWNDSLADVQPGSCGVCCSYGGRDGEDIHCLVDIGEDGTVAAFLATQGRMRSGGDGWVAAVWSDRGERIGTVEHEAATITTVAVDAKRRRVLVGYFYNSNTGHEPMVMPSVAYHSYVGAASGRPLPELFRDFPWDARPYREAGPCDGNVADGRIEAVRIGRDGTLVLAGRSDGGDSPWYCGLRNVQRSVDFVAVDDYTSAYNMQAQAITNLVLADADAGEARLGQVLVGRLSNSGGNTMVTTAATTSESGVVYAMQDAACCLPEMANLTVNGHALAPPSDASAFFVASPTLRRRPHWTHFSLAGDVGKQAPVDLDVRGGAVALLSNAEGGMVEVEPLSGSGSPNKGQQAGFAYLVVLPEVDMDDGLMRV